MNALLLGGTGAMGRHLVEILSQSDMEIYVTSRTPPHESAANVRYLEGNAQDVSFLKKILSRHYNVIVDFMVYTTSTFSDHINMLLQATDQYVFLSSCRVYAYSPVPITERSPRLLDTILDCTYLKMDEYALTKARQENILRNSGFRNWTIIRPYITYSEKRLQLGVLEKEQWLYRSMAGRTIVFSEDIASKSTTLTYGLDVAQGIAAIIGNPNAQGQTYHITNKNSVDWQTVLSIYIDTIERKQGKRPKYLLTQTSLNLKIPTAKYQVLYDRLYDRRFNNEKIEAYIDTAQFVSAQEGLRRCLEAFLEEPIFGPINWQLEALCDKTTGEWTSLKEIDSFKHKCSYLLYRLCPISLISRIRLIAGKIVNNQ